MTKFRFVDPSKEFLLGIDYSNGEEFEDSNNMLIIGFFIFEIIFIF